MPRSTPSPASQLLDRFPLVLAWRRQFVSLCSIKSGSMLQVCTWVESKSAGSPHPHTLTGGARQTINFALCARFSLSRCLLYLSDLIEAKYPLNFKHPQKCLRALLRPVIVFVCLFVCLPVPGF